MRSSLSRRALLTCAASSLATAALADAPLVSLRPVARGMTGPRARTTTEQMIAQAQLGGNVGFIIADAATGEVLESIDANVALPPASVTKAVTALYSIEAMGAQFCFETRLFADGEIKDGILDGNLILAGGGDPNLVTDDLAELAERLKAAGLKEVRGDFVVWDDALTNLAEIDDSQLDHLSYNPTITGLNLNFNRVHFEWKRASGKYTIAMDARSEQYRPVVTMARMRIVDRRAPTFTYEDGNGVDEWTVARSALGGGGARWLPVRYPALYAGEVFASFARTHGIVLKPARIALTDPQGTVIAKHKSVPLSEMMRDMLKYSTNITAEAAGLAATLQRTGHMRGLRTSALSMTRWAERRANISPMFVDHSGLGDESRISAGDMLSLLAADGVAPTLRPLMKRIDMVDEKRRVIASHPGEVHAKTGTLNFVSALAGYISTAGGRELAFVFFGADLDARERGKRSGNEQPTGSATWNRKAKALQQRILQRWAAAQ